MKILLLGVTGRVGSRVLPALLAHKHRVVAYVRTPGKISSEARSQLDSIVVGSASDSAAIKAAILSHNCDGVVNAAGLAALTGWTAQGEFPAIFAAVVQAAVEAGRERGNMLIRCWLMSGFSVLNSPKKPYFLLDYGWTKPINLVGSDAALSSIPIYPSHMQNYLLIKSHPADVLAWSLFCASKLPPKYDKPRFPPPVDVSASNLLASADAAPAWAEKYRSIPLIGNCLNIMGQAGSYYAVLENCVDFMASDLEKGLESEWIGKRVGVKEKSKA